MNSTAASLHADENTLSSSYGISEWPDTKDVYERLATLVRQPIRPIRRENMNTVLKYFQEKCITSLRVSEEASRVITGGDTSPTAYLSEERFLELEAEAFLSLAGEEKTHDRLMFMLEKGKPLRN